MTLQTSSMKTTHTGLSYAIQSSFQILHIPYSGLMAFTIFHIDSLTFKSKMTQKIATKGNSCNDQ